MGIEVQTRPPQALSLDDFETPFGDYLGAVGQDIVDFNLMTGLFRSEQLADQELGQRADGYSGRMGMLTGDERYLRREAPETPVLDRATATDRIKAAGLEGRLSVPDEGMREGALDLFIGWKQAEIKAADKRARAPGSYAWAGVPLEIVGGILDPVNVAASFIPVVGEARWAYMLSRAGASKAARAAAYAKRGIIEGGVGSLAVEPLTLAFQSQQQADYGLMDSVLNVTFGTLLGGGLHVAAGALGGGLRAPAPAPRQAAAAATVTPTPAAAADATVRARLDEGPVTRDTFDPIEARLRESRPKSIEEARVLAARELSDEITADATARASEIAETGTVAGIRAERDRLALALEAVDERAIAKQINKARGITRKQAEARARRAAAEQREDLTQKIARLDNAIEANKRGAAGQADLGALKRGEIPETYRERVEARAQAILNAPVKNELSAAIAKAFSADGIAARATPEQRESMLRTAIADMQSGRPPNVEPIADTAGLTTKRGGVADAQASAAANQERTLFGGAEESAAAQRLIDEAPKTGTVEEAMAALTEDVAEQTRRLDELARNADAGLEEPRLAEEMKEMMSDFADAEKSAKEVGKAVRAAAVCMTRIG